MTDEGRAKIIDNNFADLFITYGGNLSRLEKFNQGDINYLDSINVVVYVPAEEITNNTIKQMGYSVMPTLFGLISQRSLEASGVLRIRSVPNFNLKGQGVIIGIIDTGIDYTNPIFRNADNTSRILSIWDQTISSNNYPPNLNYGTVYTREQINEALQSETPLQIVPSTDEIGHGTMIAGIAAGNEVPESDFYGVAPDTELVIVKLKQAKPYLRDFFKIPQNAVCFQENDIYAGVMYLDDYSIQVNRPMVFCIGLGSSQGAHDGRGILSSNLSIRAFHKGNAIVIAAGNEGSARRHYFAKIDPTIGYDTVELNVGENEGGFSMELWGSSPQLLTVDIQSPSGEYIPKIFPLFDENREVSFIFDTTIIFIDYQMIEAESGDQLILMRFSNPSPGIWKFKVYGKGDLGASFHIWLPMEGFISNNTYFIRSDPYTTILSLGNAQVPITVTAYNTEDNSLYFNASRGYTRTGFVKPEIAAPGVNILSPTASQGFQEVTGTCPAAAHTAGIAAMILQWAIIQGNYPTMNTLNLKSFLVRGAKRDEKIVYPNRDWGYGILDVFNVFDSLRRVNIPD